MTLVAIYLYEPSDPPEIPSKKIGRASLSYDTWEKVGGVGKYADARPMKHFRLMHREPLSAFAPGKGIAVTAAVVHIICEGVPIWRNGSDTYKWRAVVPDVRDRAMLAEKTGGNWVG